MTSTRLLCLVGAGIGLLPGLASASIFTFSYYDTATSGATVSVSATLIGTDLGGSQYLITSISGTRNGAAITGLVSGGPSQTTYNLPNSDLFTYDDALNMSGGSYWDGDGLLYTVSGFTYPFNVFSSPGWYWELGYDGTGYTPNNTGEAVAMTVVDVTAPEPGAAVYVLLGLGLIVVVARRTRRPAARPS